MALGLDLGFLLLANHVSLGKLTSLEFDSLIYIIIILVPILQDLEAQ